LGACDVLPFVPVDGITLDECAALAHLAGKEIWQRFHVPVFFYEAAALSESRRRLENIRRGEFEGVRLQPDVGTGLHPTAGATVVGARRFLIAYNINLATPDVTIAKAIARKIRESSGGLPHVKALGLYLASRNQAQVSMNLTDYEITPLHVAFRAVEQEALAHDVEIAGSELIGLIPRRALRMAAGVDLRWENLSELSIFENRLEAAIKSM
jgi:glutamate formiminotransferase